MRTIDSTYGPVVIFDSATEAIQACNPASFQSDEDKLGRKLPTWKAVVDAIDQPWKEGLEVVQKFIDKLEDQELPEIKSIVRRIRFDEDDGDEIDLDRLRAGQPFWRVSRRQTSTGPTEVTIVVSLAAEKGVSPTDILWRGAAAIAMADILERQGFSVALWAVQCSCPYGDDQYRRLTVAIPLKDHGDRLDLSTLVNTVSGWFYRSVLFTLVRSLVARDGKRIAKGLGTPESPYHSDLDLFTKPDNRLYAAHCTDRWGAQYTAERGLQQVRESQKPDVNVYVPEPDPMPVPTTPSSPPPPAKKAKPMKFKPYKAPKRQTQD